MGIYFCQETGRRIAAPGVCKAVDKEKGHDEIVEIDDQIYTMDQVEKLSREAKRGKDVGGAHKPPADTKNDNKPPTGGQ